MAMNAGFTLVDSGDHMAGWTMNQGGHLQGPNYKTSAPVACHLFVICLCHLLFLLGIYILFE